jgi:alpha-amylase/alpha-mannosidase (GH57 family)
LQKYICIHGHFYQPPRENPWLGEVELQDAAYPYHDWNQRITAECYAPNAASRILDLDRKIIDIVNNYSKISFNFGPTLLSWIQNHDPEVYRVIIEADKESQKNFSGHGSAIAQCYNHMIMPLANTRDKKTQIIWGVRDFEFRFKRKPEGMWLPEAAIDLETLDIMTEFGIKFTILAAGQAKRVRKIGDKKWKDVSGEKIDPKMPYLCHLPSGRTIVLFFYDGPISKDVAFGEVLENGENFARRLTGVFSEQEGPQLVHIATDGETYGHHHSYGDMALAYCLYYLESKKLARITIYGEYLEKHPPTHEVEVFENSSWSCIHGVERWRNNCGCNLNMHPGWTQEWRAPLRGAMDWLRDNLARIYEEQISQFVADPWRVRDEYVEVILDRSRENVERFLSKHSVKELSGEDKVKIVKLLEMQRNAMFMYTSCGWFFDEISGIETVQVLQYAARAMQLAREVSNMSLEDTYINLLERAPSNIPEFKNGAQVYEMLVKPSVLNLARVGVHFAVSSLFEEYPESIKIYSYVAHSQMYDRVEVGRQKLAVGRARIRSDITWDENTVSFAVLHLGDHNIVGGVRQYSGEDLFNQMHQEIKETFLKSDISETMRLIEKHFEEHSYSLWHLFKDEQRKVLNQILSSTLKDIENSLLQIKEHHFPITQAMRQMNVPLPKALAVTMELAFNIDLLQALENEPLDTNRLKNLVVQAKRWSIEVDKTTLGFVASNEINNIMQKFLRQPQDIGLLEAVDSLLSILNPLSLNLNLWKAQNIYFSIGKQIYGEMKEKANTGDESAKRWIERISSLGEYLKVKIE